MKRTLKLPLVIVVLLALSSGFAMHAAAGTPDHAAPAAADLLPFKGTLEGRHISRTPLDPPFVFDRFEADGQAIRPRTVPAGHRGDRELRGPPGDGSRDIHVHRRKR